MSLIEDFKYRDVSNGRIMYNLFFDRGSSAVFLYRLSNWCVKHRLKPIAIIARQLNIILNNCEISYNAEIGLGFKIYHAFGIVIGDAKIGEKFAVFQNTTVGKNVNHSQYPIIGDNVTMYTGSVIVGAIVIGDNVSVGANTVVTKDVPGNSSLIGAKAQYI